MIISKIQAGLGNQMFQYAAGRALALRHHTELALNTSWYEGRKAVGDTSRPYELERLFTLAARPATEHELKAVRLVESPSRWKRRFGKLVWPQLPTIAPLWEQDFRFQPDFLTAPDNSYLVGWWQSERYFKEAEQQIRAELSFKPAPNEANAKLLKEIKKVVAVSIHVRRGDYVSNPDATKFHGLKGVDYYQAAAKQIEPKVQKPHYFVFSDDPTWCKDNLTFNHPTTYVEHNSGADSFEDMRLMSSCRHHIIANSSFSWWGAWLNPSPDKIVVGPKNWFNDPDTDTSDVLPKEWIQL